MAWHVTNHISPYGIQTKECKTIEDAFAFIAENQAVISEATISHKRATKKEREQHGE